MEEDNNNDNNKVVEAEIISDSKENEEKEESREPEEKAEEKEEKEDKKEEKKEKREEKKRKAGLFAKKHEEEKEENEVEVRIDWKKAAKIFDARWLWVLLILIPIILTSTIRIQPNTLAITQDWATGTVYNVYKNSIAQQVVKKLKGEH